MGQDSRERQLRRYLRRLREAHWCSLTDRPVFQGLRANLLATARQWNVLQHVRSSSWGAAVQQLEAKLSDNLKDQMHTRLHAWKHRVQSFPSACKWVKAKPPPGWSLKDESGELHSGRCHGVCALRDAWLPVFIMGPPDYSPQTQQYLEHFGQWHPVRPVVVSPPLSPESLRKAVLSMRAKAAGADAWEASTRAYLPSLAFERLVHVLMAVGRTGYWPKGLRGWRLSFLPNREGEKSTEVLRTRPIAVGPVIYTAWSKVRFSDVASRLDPQCLGQLQYGGLRGHDRESLLVALQNEASTASHAYAVTLDFAKAFDCTDWRTALSLLERAGACPNVPRALGGMWRDHRRWVTFGGLVDPRPIDNAPALLQGDVWAPLAMSLVLGGLHRNVHDLVACRTLWTQFETLGCLRTNESKTQIWGRAAQARRLLHAAGLPAAAGWYYAGHRAPNQVA